MYIIIAAKTANLTGIVGMRGGRIMENMAACSDRGMEFGWLCSDGGVEEEEKNYKNLKVREKSGQIDRKREERTIRLRLFTIK